MIRIVEKYNKFVDNDKALELIDRLNYNFNFLNDNKSYYDYIKFIDENNVILKEFKNECE